MVQVKYIVPIKYVSNKIFFPEKEDSKNLFSNFIHIHFLLL